MKIVILQNIGYMQNGQNKLKKVKYLDFLILINKKNIIINWLKRKNSTGCKGKNWEVLTTSGTYSWSFVTQILCND